MLKSLTGTKFPSYEDFLKRDEEIIKAMEEIRNLPIGEKEVSSDGEIPSDDLFKEHCRQNNERVFMDNMRLFHQGF